MSETMKIQVECQDSVKKKVVAKDISVGVPVYVPKKWFEARKSNKLTVLLILLPEDKEELSEEEKKEPVEEEKETTQETERTE